MRQISLWVKAAFSTKWGSTVNMALCVGFTTRCILPVSGLFTVFLRKVQFSLFFWTSFCSCSWPEHDSLFFSSVISVWRVLPVFSLFISALKCPRPCRPVLSVSGPQSALPNTEPQFHHWLASISSPTCRILNQDSTVAQTGYSFRHDTHTHAHTASTKTESVPKLLLTHIMIFFCDVRLTTEKLCDRAGTTVYVVSVT